MRELTDDVLFDKRLIERHLRQGLLSEADLKKRLEGTDDLTERADYLDLDAMQGEIEGASRRSERAA